MAMILHGDVFTAIRVFPFVRMCLLPFSLISFARLAGMQPSIDHSPARDSRE